MISGMVIPMANMVPNNDCGVEDVVANCIAT
jgi:hypothetical protein